MINPYIVYLSGGRNTNRNRLQSLCGVWSKKNGAVRVLVSEATADGFRDEIKGTDFNVVIDQIAFSNGKQSTYLGIFLELIKRAPLGSLKKIPKDVKSNLFYDRHCPGNCSWIHF